MRILVMELSNRMYSKTELGLHYFPGNNTPEGFFSYYSYILDQKEAKRIYCIKGGPGSGKSTFMRKIGEEFLDRGMNVDFLACRLRLWL